MDRFFEVALPGISIQSHGSFEMAKESREPIMKSEEVANTQSSDGAVVESSN